MLLSREEKHIHFFFSAGLEPVLTIEPGRSVTIQTRDASDGQIRPGRLATAVVRSDRLLPVTGPIRVDGASVGDVLGLTINDIALVDAGHAWLRRGLGLRQTDVGDGYHVREFEVSEDIVKWKAFQFPRRTMVGIIGVATEEQTRTRLPGNHGGNLDCTSITVGATIWLPIMVPGANFSVGDVHAAMGDGEVSGTGVEIAAEVSVTATLRSGEPLYRPKVETPCSTVFLASADSLEFAVSLALEDAVTAVSAARTLSMNDAYLLASLAGNARICQVVNGKVTAGYEIPASLLGERRED